MYESCLPESHIINLFSGGRLGLVRSVGPDLVHCDGPDHEYPRLDDAWDRLELPLELLRPLHWPEERVHQQVPVLGIAGVPPLVEPDFSVLAPRFSQPGRHGLPCEGGHLDWDPHVVHAQLLRELLLVRDDGGVLRAAEQDLLLEQRPSPALDQVQLAVYLVRPVDDLGYLWARERRHP